MAAMNLSLKQFAGDKMIVTLQGYIKLTFTMRLNDASLANHQVLPMLARALSEVGFSSACAAMDQIHIILLDAK